MSEDALPRRRFKLLIAAVGGQGALTAARFLGDAALAAGFPVKVGQLHGMSQRGGSVECSVLIGPGQSSFIGDGEADVVLALEPLEALRSVPKMAATSRVVLSSGCIVPFVLAMQGIPYPPLHEILAQIRAVTPRLFVVDGPGIMREVGGARALNVVMLGAVCGLHILPFGPEPLWAAIEKQSPRRFMESNLKAFELGRRAVRDNEVAAGPERAVGPPGDSPSSG